MPSARQIEVQDLSTVQTNGRREELNVLLHEIQVLNISHLTSLHGRGRILFAEGEPACGIYLLRAGRATLSISSSEGQVVILRMVQAGDVLGLNSTLRNASYQTTIKTLEPCRTDFIARAELLNLMEKSPTGTQAMLQILGRELAELTDRARSLLLPPTASARLAKLLLAWGKESGLHPSGEIRVERLFTQEEMAQMICSSRETVTRLLAMFSRRQIIRITPDSILISDPVALEGMALH